MSKEEKLPPRALMDSAAYFRVNPTQIAPMAKDIKMIDFTNQDWKFSRAAHYAYLNDVVADLVKQQELRGHKEILALVGRPTSSNKAQKVSGETLEVLDLKSKTKQQFTVLFQGLAGFPYPRARRTVLVLVTAAKAPPG